MRMRRHLAMATGALCLVAGFASGCGGGATGGARPVTIPVEKSKASAAVAWVDPTYRPSTTVLTTLAIAPASNSGTLANRIDQGFESAFLNTPGIQLRGLPAHFRERLNGDRKLAQTLDHIAAETYSAADLAAGPTLSRILSPEALAEMRTTLNACSLLLVPARFEIHADDKRTTGQALCRTYDLTNGHLVLQNTYGVTVPEGGEAGEKHGAIELILAIEADFEARLVHAH
jgi:hypothetical protein